MSKKCGSFLSLGFLGLFAAIILIGGLSWGHKGRSGIGILPLPDSSLRQGKTIPAVPETKAPALIRDFGRVPVYFVPNRGQADDRVSFYVQGADKTIYFAPEGLTLAMSYPARSGSEGESKRWVVKLDFLSAREDVKPEGLEKTGATISYFRGKPEEWKTGLTAYSRIIYRDLWPGIDLVYKGELDRLKYEFIVHPGADPSEIKLAYRGAESVALTDKGRLEVRTPAGAFEDDVPTAYQESEGEREAVPVAYSPDSPRPGSEERDHAYGFAVGEYDRKRTLVIDPIVLVYCGYIGGASSDNGSGIAVDGLGNAYITGGAGSDESTFPVTVGPDLTYNNSWDDAFVAKVNVSGTGLIYCGYIGGAGRDAGVRIAIDDSGNAYVAGRTGSDETTFPVTVGPDLTYNGGEYDAFVAKVNASGTGLVYCGYIGGTEEDQGKGVGVDNSGNACVSGFTYSPEGSFPVKVGPDLTYNGAVDAFVAKVDSSGTGLAYCGYIGGSGLDASRDIAVGGSGDAFVTGNTVSTNFPVRTGPDLTHNGDNDAFVAKVSSSGGIDYCGYIGGSNYDYGSGIAVDDSGNAYVTGISFSDAPGFPLISGPTLYNKGQGDIFLTKVGSLGAALVYSGFIGGTGRDEGMGIAVDSAGNAYITGITSSIETGGIHFPVTDGPDLTYNGGASDAFVAVANPSGTALVYCGYVGGSEEDTGYGIAVDDSGYAYLAGYTKSDQSTFPVVAGPDLTLNGTGAALAAKIGNVPGPPITSLLPDSAEAGDPGILLSVIGSEFVDGAVVRWDGSPRPTTFVNSSELNAEIAAADLVAGKTVIVTVRNPDGGVSNALPFTIDNPVPTLSSLSTTHVTGGGAAFTLTVQGSSFVPNSVVRWDGSDRATTYVSATELQTAITATDIATGGDIQVSIINPAPAGGASGALTLQVSSFTVGSTPTSATVTAGQSATYTIQLTPQYGSFDAAVTFNCVGLPSKCTASFAPASATPGAAAVTTTLTLTTAASSDAAGSASGSISGAGAIGPPAAGLCAFVLTLLLTYVIGRRSSPRRLSRRWLAACAVACLVILIGSCSAGGGGDDNTYTGTRKGTHTISVQATSGNMTVPTSITLVVN